MYESFVCRLHIIKMSLVNTVLFSKIKVFATKKIINQPNRIKRILLLLMLIMISIPTIHAQVPIKGGEWKGESIIMITD